LFQRYQQLQKQHDLPQLTEGVVWFRLHLFVDSNLLKEQLALIIQQSGASKIYLNGSLIYSFGVFDTDPAKVKAYDPLGQPVAFSRKKRWSSNRRGPLCAPTRGQVVIRLKHFIHYFPHFI